MPAPNYNLVESQTKSLPILLQPEDCLERTYIVTGANSGLGFECAKHLVKLGTKRVIITVRNLEKGREAKKRIEAETNKKDVIEIFELDLTTYQSVHAFVKKLEADVTRVDGVIANAGTSNGDWETHEGMEGNFTVNLFSNVLLLALMVPYLKDIGAKLGITPRFTFVGSIGPFVAPKSPLSELNRSDIFNDLNNKEKWGDRELSYRYVLSKLMLHITARELATRAKSSEIGVIINVTEPGLCNTGLTKRQKWTVRLTSWIMLKLLGRTPEVGSRAIIAGLALGEESHGTFVSDCEPHDDRIPEWLTNEDGQVWQQRIWEEVSTRLESVQPGCLDWVARK